MTSDPKNPRKVIYSFLCALIVFFVCLLFAAITLEKYNLISGYLYRQLPPLGAPRTSTPGGGNDLPVDTKKTKPKLPDNEIREVHVTTKLGKLFGKVLQLGDDGDVDAFYGIPFAEPPVGDLRFKRTVPAKKWNGLYNATYWRPSCWQILPPEAKELTIVSDFLYPDDMSEDCLQLNIWRPSAKSDSLRTVMLYIHGGGSTFGTPVLDETDGRALAAVGDVIVVTINYRLGSLGFLDGGVEDSPGNQAFYDQLEAFRWVKQNIEDFGGDPNSITMFGESFGAIMLGMHLLSPKTKDLYHRMILQSGSPMLIDFSFSQTRDGPTMMAIETGCMDAGEDFEEIAEDVIDCLRGKTPEEMMAAQVKHVVSLYFYPTANEEFLPELPSLAIKEPTVLTNLKEVLMGINSHEGSLFLHITASDLFTKTDIPNVTNLTVARNLVTDRVIQLGVPEGIAKVMIESLIQGPEIQTKEEIAAFLINLVTDLLFWCPEKLLLDKLAERNVNTYMYKYTHRSTNSRFAPWFGVNHYDEVWFVFGYPIRYPEKYTQQEVEFSRRIIKTWTHFAKTGEMLDQMEMEWPQYTVNDPAYLELNPKYVNTSSGYRTQQCAPYQLGFDTFG